MGLAAYGEPTYVEQFRELVRLRPDGRYELDLSWFRHHATGKHQVSQKFVDSVRPARGRRPATRSRSTTPTSPTRCRTTLEEAGLHVARWLPQHTGETAAGRPPAGSRSTAS